MNWHVPLGLNFSFLLHTRHVFEVRIMLLHLPVAWSFLTANQYSIVWIHSLFSLFLVVMFYKITSNTEFSEYLLIDHRGNAGVVPATCLFHQLIIYNLVLCVFLSEDTVFTI